MSALGLRVIRFTASEVSYRMDAVMEAILYATREMVLSDDTEKQWRYASSLALGHIVYFGTDRQPVTTTGLAAEYTAAELFSLELEGVPSLLTGVCAVHNGAFH